MENMKKAKVQAEAIWNEEKECWGVSLTVVDFFGKDSCAVTEGKYKVYADEESAILCALLTLYGMDTPNDEEVVTIDEQVYR